ncbi:MAG: glycogen debranching enzyme GlgX, partial [Acidimicrobiales bacterium]|nr:glycogen debranching enzyme GlgX [Acidimicrobiales bacterium]
TTLLLSQGVPMILGGDEIGRTQGGNNNAYCQDNEVSWYDWANADGELLTFVSALIHLRREHPTFRRRQFFQGRTLHGEDTIDLQWFTADGSVMSDEQWNEGDLKTVTIYLGGGTIEQSARGEQITDTDVLWFLNASDGTVEFTVPPEQWGEQWRCVLDTATGQVGAPEAAIATAGATVELVDRSLMLFVRVDEDPAAAVATTPAVNAS